MGKIIPYIMENKKCSKLQTSYIYIIILYNYIIVWYVYVRIIYIFLNKSVSVLLCKVLVGSWY